MSECHGEGWPNPREPGAPAAALDGGFHWMAWPTNGTVTMGEWNPDVWGWVISYRGGIVGPEEMAHLDYLGPADLPDHLCGEVSLTPNSK